MPVLYLSVVVDLIGVGIIIPLLPFYAQAYGASPLLVSLLVASFSLAQLVSAPLLGRLSDRIGRRPVLLGCMALSLTAYLVLAVADSLLLIFLARTLNGVGAGKISVANAIVTDITPPDRRAKNLGRLSSAFGIGFILGPFLGSVLATVPPAPNYHLPMLAAAGLCAVAIVLAAVMVKESLPTGNRQSHTTSVARDLGAVLGNPAALSMVGVMFVFAYAFAHVVAINALWVQAVLGWGPAETGLQFALIAAVLFAVQGGGIGPLVRHLGERGVLVLGLVLMGGPMLLVPWGDTPVTFTVLNVLIAIGISLIGPVSNTLLSHTAPADAQGGVLGIGQSANALGQVIGPGVAGAMFGAYGPHAPYVEGGTVLLAMLLVATLGGPRRNR